MLKFLNKRPADGEGGGSGLDSNKTPRVEDGAEREGNGAQESAAPEPRTLMTWNCNGLTCRAQSAQQVAELQAMLWANQPDVVAIQEVRMPASAPKGAKKGDGQPRSRTVPNTNTPTGRKDAEMVGKLLRSKELANYEVFYSLADWKYAGSALLVRRPCRPMRVRYSLKEGAPQGQHHTDGRVIFAEFETFDLLATYSPNNGWTPSSFERRRQWDAQVTEFLRRRREGGRAVVYVGDLNVAPEDIDLSHPEFFRTRAPEENGRGGGPRPAPAENPDDRGQPGCTNNERRRFFLMLDQGGLVDAYRCKAGSEFNMEQAAFAAGPHFSWRGSRGSDIAERGRYYGKGMRIDHLLVSEELMARVADAQILGRGPEAKGFLGSDHCPMLLTLLPSP